MISTSLVMGISIFLLAINLHFKVLISDAISEGEWGDFIASVMLPTIALIIYMFAFGLGVGSLPWTLLGELVPTRVSGIYPMISPFEKVLSHLR